MTIGHRVRELRRERGLTQEGLARQADVSLNAVHKLEMGRITDPHFSTLEAIAHGLGMTVSQLVGEEEPVPKASASPETGQPKDKAPQAQVTRRPGHIQVNQSEPVGMIDNVTPQLIDNLAQIVDAWRAGLMSREEAERKARKELVA